MKKHIINVPPGTEHLSDWKEFFSVIPHNLHLILNKKICGCGATEAYLRTDKKVILASPRKHLLYNKYSQHLTDNFLLYRYLGDKDKYLEGDKSDANLAQYETNLLTYVHDGGKKILTTYDSLGKIIQSLESNSYPLDWIVVVDEFQAMFYDSQIKADTELQFHTNLSKFESVVYLSATPYLESYLDKLDEFKNQPLYELQWEDAAVQQLNVEVIKSQKSILALARDIITNYKNGNGRTTSLPDGSTVVSKEAVFYLNNVSEIVKVINKTGLTPQEASVICSSTSENKAKIKKITTGSFSIDEVPGKTAKRKMFTFCTSTVYIGADFYSDNAYSYIFSSPQVGCLTLDVSVDIQQILGRQRLETNPFRNSATLYFSTKASTETQQDLEELIQKKNEETQKEIENFLAVPNKSLLLDKLEKDIKSGGHKNHYCSIIRKPDGSTDVVKNNLLEVSERRAWEVRNAVYNSDFSMYKALSVSTSITKKADSDDSDIQTLFEEWNKSGFPKKMMMFCKLKVDHPEVFQKCNFFQKKFFDYYEALGEEGLGAMEWREDYIKKALEPKPFDTLPKAEIAQKLILELQGKDKIKKDEVKNILKKIYKELSIKGTPAASDITNYLTCKETTFREKKKVCSGYKIESLYRTNVSVFQKITDVKKPDSYCIDKILDIIKDSSYFNLKEKTKKTAEYGQKEAASSSESDMEKYRSLKNKAKMNLPCVCFNGTFKTKNRNDILVYSSFTALDFDHIKPEEMVAFAEKLKGYPCVYAFYKSPSGLGYKVIVLHDNYQPEYHSDLYQQLLDYFGLQGQDTSVRDLARGNYLAYDPDVWRNTNPTPFHYVPSSEPIKQEVMKTQTVVKDDVGEEMLIDDDSWVSRFLHKLSREVISDDTIINILRKQWTGEAVEKHGKNYAALSYSGVLCKAGVEKSKALSFVQELIPDGDVEERVEYAYEKNVFGCERRKYFKRK